MNIDQVFTNIHSGFRSRLPKNLTKDTLHLGILPLSCSRGEFPRSGSRGPHQFRRVLLRYTVNCPSQKSEVSDAIQDFWEPRERAL